MQSTDRNLGPHHHHPIHMIMVIKSELPSGCIGVASCDVAAWVILTSGIWVPSVRLGREGRALCDVDTMRARARLFCSKRALCSMGCVLEWLGECGQSFPAGSPSAFCVRMSVRSMQSHRCHNCCQHHPKVTKTTIFLQPGFPSPRGGLIFPVQGVVVCE